MVPVGIVEAHPYMNPWSTAAMAGVPLAAITLFTNSSTSPRLRQEKANSPSVGERLTLLQARFEALSRVVFRSPHLEKRTSNSIASSCISTSRNGTCFSI
jgi:hypothetical protein